MSKYRLNEPFLSELETRYVLDVLASNWLSSNGAHTESFERKFASYVGVKHCIAVQSGTAALHLALRALGVGENDRVIVPNYSCGASISSVAQCGAIPVVMDIEDATYGLDAENLERAIQKHSPKAIQLVHVYGYPARDTLVIRELCDQYGIYLVEDACEALGATLNDKMLGQFGDIAVFSLRSEKMIGVGEGGVVVTSDGRLHDEALLLASRAAPFRGGESPYWRKYCYRGEGYNYLLPHLLGAVARGQIERFEGEILPAKRRVGLTFRELFSELSGIQLQTVIPQASPVYWLNTVFVEGLTREEVRELGEALIAQGVEIRSGFWPLSDMEGFKAEVFGSQEIAQSIFDHLLVLPSASSLTTEDLGVIRELFLTHREALGKASLRASFATQG